MRRNDTDMSKVSDKETTGGFLYAISSSPRLTIAFCSARGGRRMGKSGDISCGTWQMANFGRPHPRRARATDSAAAESWASVCALMTAARRRACPFATVG